MSGNIVITGNIAVDMLVHQVETIPWGQTALVNAIEQHLGGNAGNTSNALARLGESVSVVGAVGCDPFGDFALARLRDAGVDASAVERLDAPTATIIAMVNGKGDRGFLYQLGVSGETWIDPEAFAVQVRGARHYHIAGPFRLTRLRGHYPELLRRAHAAGLTTSLDAQWDHAGRWMADLDGVLPFLDLLFVNEDEAHHLSGALDPDEAAARLRTAGARVVVVKLGAAGCRIYSGGPPEPVPGFRAAAIDTTGAGDCFCAGFLAEYLRGAGLEACGRFGNGVAGMSVEKLGGTATAASRAATEEWMRRHA